MKSLELRLRDSGAGRVSQAEGRASAKASREHGLPRHLEELGLARDLGRKMRLGDCLCQVGGLSLAGCELHPEDPGGLDFAL